MEILTIAADLSPTPADDDDGRLPTDACRRTPADGRLLTDAYHRTPTIGRLPTLNNADIDADDDADQQPRSDTTRARNRAKSRKTAIAENGQVNKNAARSQPTPLALYNSQIVIPRSADSVLFWTDTYQF